MKVKRYDLIHHHNVVYMEEEEGGDYVRYDDYAELLKTVEMLEADRYSFRIRAEESESEVVRLMSALDDAALAR